MARRHDGARGRWLGAVLVLAGALGFVVLAGWPLWDSATYRPILDQAVHELRIRDVATADQPLVGPASTGGMNHPGPLGFTVLALPYHLLGGSSKAALVGAGLVALGSAAAAIAVMGWVGGRRPAWITAVFTAMLLATFGADRVFDVWNPNVALVPFLLLLVCVWGVTCGRFALAPAAVIAASFVLQNHVSFAVPVAAMATWCVVGGLLAARRDTARPAERTGQWGWLLLALAAGVACWALPVAQEVAGPEGNMRAILSYASEGRDAAGLPAAVGVLARHAGGLPTWAGAPETDGVDRAVVAPASVLWLAAPLVGMVLAVVWSWRGGRGDIVHLVVTVVVAGAAGVVAVSQMPHPILLHYVRWLWPVSLLGWVAVVWSALEVLPPRASAVVDRALRPVALVAIGVIGVHGWTQRPAHPWPSPPHEEELVEIIDQTMAALPPDLAGPVLVESDGTLGGKKIHTGLQLQLERHGIPVAVPDRPGFDLEYGSHRAERRPRAHIQVGTGGMAAQMVSDPDGVIIYTSGAGGGDEAVVVVLTDT